MSERWQPAQVFHPGALIREELRERGWGIDRLAAALRCTEAEAQELLRGQRDVNGPDHSTSSSTRLTRGAPASSP